MYEKIALFYPTSVFTKNLNKQYNTSCFHQSTNHQRFQLKTKKKQNKKMAGVTFYVRREQSERSVWGRSYCENPPTFFPWFWWTFSLIALSELKVADGVYSVKRLGLVTSLGAGECSLWDEPRPVTSWASKGGGYTHFRKVPSHLTVFTGNT